MLKVLLLAPIFVAALYSQPQFPTVSANVALASTAYRFEGPAQEVAPGQVMLLTVQGLRTLATDREVPIISNSGWPTSLQGISVELVQGNPSVSTPLALRGIWQGFCEVPEACSSITGITLQIPFFLQKTNIPAPYLRIKDNGSPVGAVAIRPVSDKIHIMNTCDATQITLGGFASAPQNICTPAVLSNGVLNSLYNLVKPGDHLAMWAFGLGNLTPEPPPSNSNIDPATLFSPPAFLRLNFDYRPNAPASPAVPGYGVTATPEYAGHIGQGSYQVNFTVPPAPLGLPACDGINIKSNLTVTLSGPNSYDAAQLCVNPR